MVNPYTSFQLQAFKLLLCLCQMVPFTDLLLVVICHLMVLALRHWTASLNQAYLVHFLHSIFLSCPFHGSSQFNKKRKDECSKIKVQKGDSKNDRISFLSCKKINIYPALLLKFSISRTVEGKELLS